MALAQKKQILAVMVEAAERAIQEAKLPPGELTMELLEWEVPRIVWTREQPRFYRYIQFAPLEEFLPKNCYLLQWGQYHNPSGATYSDTDNFDAKIMGGLRYVLPLFREWLIELKRWTELPRLPEDYLE